MLPWKGTIKRWFLKFGLPLAIRLLVSLIAGLSPSTGMIHAAELDSGIPGANRSTEESSEDSFEGEGWTLESLQELALQNNPTLSQAAASADMARGLYRQAGIYPNPRLGYLRNDGNKPTGPRSKGVFIGQEVITAGKLKKAKAAETWEIEQKNWNYEAQVHRVYNDVELRYWEALAAQRIQIILSRLKKIAARSLEIAEQQMRGNQVGKPDVLQARIQLRSVELMEREAIARAESTWKQLETVTGCPGLQRADLLGSLPDDFPELDWETSYRRLIDESPLLQSVKAHAQHNQGQYQLEVANRVPNFNVQVVADRDSNDKVSSVSTLISMPIPVTNRNQGNIYRAAAGTREAAAEITRTELALRDQLAETFRRYESAKESVQKLGEEIVPDAEEMVRLTITSYQAGEVGFLNVLTAQKILVETRVAYIEALLEASKSHTEIDGLLLTGALNPAELGTALQSQGVSASRRAIINQLENNSGQGLLPAAIQTGGGP